MDHLLKVADLLSQLLLMRYLLPSSSVHCILFLQHIVFHFQLLNHSLQGLHDQLELCHALRGPSAQFVSARFLLASLSCLPDEFTDLLKFGSLCVLLLG